MSRITDGTTMSGYRCDEKSCMRNAVWTPLVCIPYEKRPSVILHESQGNMFVGMVDVHVCDEHFKCVDADDLLGPKMRDLARATANRHGCKPAFERRFLARWRVHSSEYIDFQRMGGFVPPDDAKADGKILGPV